MVSERHSPRGHSEVKAKDDSDNGALTADGWTHLAQWRARWYHQNNQGGTQYTPTSQDRHLVQWRAVLAAKPAPRTSPEVVVSGHLYSTRKDQYTDQ